MLTRADHLSRASTFVARIIPSRRPRRAWPKTDSASPYINATSKRLPARRSASVTNAAPCSQLLFVHGHQMLSTFPYSQRSRIVPCDQEYGIASLPLKVEN